MRDESSIVEQLRSAQRALDELKTAQFVGHSQIVVKDYVSSEITVTSTSTGYASEAFAHAIVTAPSILPGNILITYCVPEVYATTGLIDNKTDGRAVNVTTIETGDDNTNAYQINIYRTSTGGETIPTENYEVKFHIYSAALVDIEVAGGMYG